MRESLHDSEDQGGTERVARADARQRVHLRSRRSRYFGAVVVEGGAGGALGAITRHGAGVLTNRLIGSPMPYATAFVNIIGCAVIGVLAGGVAGGHIRMSTEARLFVFVGVLGGFTTISSFGLDTLTLFIEGRPSQALLNVVFQVGLGLSAVFVGYTLAK